MSFPPDEPSQKISSKQFYFKFAMKNNFMNTNSTRFSEQFKHKMFKESKKSFEESEQRVLHTALPSSNKDTKGNTGKLEGSNK